MSESSRSIDAIFARHTIEWTADEERELIARAQAGDANATEEILRHYAPAMKAVIAKMNVQHPESKLELEDLRQSMMLGVLEAIKDHDLERHPSLAGRLMGILHKAANDEAFSGTATIAVPRRSLNRFFHILRAADGNPYEAAALAPEYAMTTETFLAILSAVRDVRSYSAHPAGDDENGGGLDHMTASSIYGLVRTDHEVIEDDMLVAAAFRAVDFQEATVVRHSYGFNDFEPQSDAEVAHRLGLSRPKVQRVRAGALAKMRDALGVA